MRCIVYGMFCILHRVCSNCGVFMAGCICTNVYSACIQLIKHTHLIILTQPIESIAVIVVVELITRLDQSDELR